SSLVQRLPPTATATGWSPPTERCSPSAAQPSWARHRRARRTVRWWGWPLPRTARVTGSWPRTGTSPASGRPGHTALRPARLGRRTCAGRAGGRHLANTRRTWLLAGRGRRPRPVLRRCPLLRQWVAASIRPRTDRSYTCQVPGVRVTPGRWIDRHGPWGAGGP